MEKDILRGWEEIEQFCRVSRWTLRRWMLLHGCPIVGGWGKRPPIASKHALEKFIRKMATIGK